MEVTRIPFTPSIRENGLWVVRPDELTFPEGFTAVEQSFIYIPPGQKGGNHKHPRQEIFMGIGEAFFLIWQSEDEMIHEEHLGKDGEAVLFHIPSMLPHGVINRSSTGAVLYEFANEKQHDVEYLDLI